MIRKLIGFVWIVISIRSLACESCGCSSNAGYMGILPDYNKHAIGLHYSFQSYQNEQYSMETGGPVKSHMRWQIMEVQGRWLPSKRWMLSASLPFNRFTSADKSVKTAIGDGSISALFQLLPMRCDSLRWKQMLQVGILMKLPTGGLSANSDAFSGLNSWKAASGSLDYGVQAIYSLRHKKDGLQIQSEYRLNGRNRYQVRLGNQCNSLLRYYRIISVKRLQILPSVAAAIEVQAYDRSLYATIPSSGGYALWGLAGMDFCLKRWMFRLSAQIPMSQYENSGAKSGFRTDAGAYYLF